MPVLWTNTNFCSTIESTCHTRNSVAKFQNQNWIFGLVKSKVAAVLLGVTHQWGWLSLPWPAMRAVTSRKQTKGLVQSGPAWTVWSSKKYSRYFSNSSQWEIRDLMGKFHIEQTHLTNRDFTFRLCIVPRETSMQNTKASTLAQQMHSYHVSTVSHNIDSDISLNLPQTKSTSFPLKLPDKLTLFSEDCQA